MSSVGQLHDTAMGWSIKAFVTEDKNKKLTYTLSALEFERKAAGLLEPAKESEPTRSILYLSAASLALLARDYDQCEDLIKEGLMGYPSPGRKEEFEGLMGQLKEKR